MNRNEHNKISSVIFLICLFGSSFISCIPPVSSTPQEHIYHKEDSTTRITLVFGGDVMQHMPQVRAAKKDTTYNYYECFRYLKPFFDTADMVVLNLETTVSDNKRYSGYPQFASPPELISALKECGVSVVTLANNHICDKGAAGIKTTIKELKKQGIKYTGAFSDSTDYLNNNPLIIDIKGINFAILNYTYDTNGLPVPKENIVNIIDTTVIANDLLKINKEKTDYIIICFHWGVEYSRQPSNEQKELARWCKEKGVNFIIGNHPHVIQPLQADIDTLGNVKAITAYSLGNLVSNQRWRYSDGGIFLIVQITSVGPVASKIYAKYMMNWVDLKNSEGKTEYIILPSPVADTLIKEGTHTRKAYETFMNDSRNLLKDDINFIESGSYMTR